MKTPRALLLMLTGLAGGIGVRLAFTLPAQDGASARGGRAAEKSAPPKTEPATEKAGQRPEEAAVLTAHGGSRLRLLLAWLPGADGDELLRMAGALTSPPQDENLSIRLLMARWAEVNPAAMLAWARTQSGESHVSGFFVSNAIEAWARVDFDGAWSAACNGLPLTKAAALLGLTVVDPGKCLDLLRADPSLMDSRNSEAADPFDSDFETMEIVLKRLAAKEPAATAALLDSGPAARMHKFADSIALAWAKSDPAAAVAWMQRLDPGVRAASVEEAAKWIAGHAPEQLPALLESMPAGQARSTLQADGFSHLAATDAAAARRQLDAMPASPSRQFCRGLLLKELVHQGDEAGALALASQLRWQVKEEWCPGSSQTVYSNGGGSSSQGEDAPIRKAMSELMGRIATRNPQEALAIFAKSEYEAVSELLTGEKEMNPAGLAAAFLAAGDHEAMDHCDYLANTWARHDPAAAAAWAVANGGASRDRLLDKIMTPWSSDAPAMMAWAATVDAGTVASAWEHLVIQNHAYVSAHLDAFLAAAPPKSLENVLTQGGYDAGAQRSVLRHLPDDTNAPIGNAMQHWLTDKPEEAAQWVQSLPQGTRRNSATVAVVQHANSTGDHEGAFAWAATLPGGPQTSALTETVRAWGAKDADAAERAIRGSALPAEEQQKLLDTLPPP